MIKIKKDNIPIIFFEANTFKRGFDEKVDLIRTADYRRRVHDEYPIPYCVTLASFACELYIKFLVCLHEAEQFPNKTEVEIPKSHDLSDLIGKLDSKYQNEIFKSILRKKVDNISVAFVEWRYIYESNDNEKGFIYDDIKELIEKLYEISIDKMRHTNIVFKDVNTIKTSMKGTEKVSN